MVERQCDWIRAYESETVLLLFWLSYYSMQSSPTLPWKYWCPSRIWLSTTSWTTASGLSSSMELLRLKSCPGLILGTSLLQRSYMGVESESPVFMYTQTLYHLSQHLNKKVENITEEELGQRGKRWKEWERDREKTEKKRKKTKWVK